MLNNFDMNMKTNFLFLLSALFVMMLASCGKEEKDPNLVVHYIFNNTGSKILTDATGGDHDAFLLQGAVQKKIGDYNVMDLGERDGYVDMGPEMGLLINSLEDYSIAFYLRIDTAARVKANGNFVFSFSTLERCGGTTGQLVAFRVNQQRLEQSIGGGLPERELVGIMPGRPADKGVWQHYAYSQRGQNGTLYLNGEVLASGPAILQPKDIEEPPRYNWMGRPPFPGDIYLKAMYHDFRIYNKAITPEDIKALMKDLDGLNAATK